MDGQWGLTSIGFISSGALASKNELIIAANSIISQKQAEILNSSQKPEGKDFMI